MSRYIASILEIVIGMVMGGGGWELEDYARVGTIPLGVEDASRKVCSLR